MIPSNSFLPHGVFCFEFRRSNIFNVGGIHYSCPSSDFVVIRGVDPDHQPFSPTVQVPNDNELEVHGISDVFYVDCLNQGITLPDYISVIAIGEPIWPFRPQNAAVIPSVSIASWVTDIHPYSFYGAKTVTFSPLSQLKVIGGFSNGKFWSIRIPDSVRRISDKAFHQCKSLKTVEWGPNPQLEVIEGFCECHGLVSISIPDSVSKLDSSAFRNCSSLTIVRFSPNSSLTEIKGFSHCGFVTFTIPPSVEVIGSEAFESCYSLCALEFAPGSRLRTIGGFGHTRVGVVKLPDSVEQIQSDAFHNCAELSTVVISGERVLASIFGFDSCPNLLSVTMAGREWFQCGAWDFAVCPVLREVRGFGQCSLTSVVFPDGVEVIEGFNECRDLVTVGFPHSGKLKLVNGFSGTAIRKVEFPRSVEKILKFENCQFLEAVEFAADGCLKEMNAFSYADRLTEVGIPKSVESLGYYCFCDCNELSQIWLALDGCLSRIDGLSRIPIASIVIPDSVESISGLCGCLALESVSFGWGSRLREIYGFGGCGFEEIELPDSVEIVGYQAFQSEEFRVMKLGEKSRLRNIQTHFQDRPVRFFLVVPEARLSAARERLDVRLSNKPRQSSNTFKTRKMTMFTRQIAPVGGYPFLSHRR
jgi:hypothetical protein